MQLTHNLRQLRARTPAALTAAALAIGPLAALPAGARAAVIGGPQTGLSATPPAQGGGSLESAASKAGQTGRKIAMSLIGLGFAIASVVLVFRRDFKEAAGVFAVGIVAILLATPAGENVLHDTVTSLFGAS